LRLLLEHKADVDAKDKNEWTALHRAVENGHDAAARRLLKHKANVNVKDNYGQRCMGRPRMVKRL
jgi:ankyrin repeat protein